MKSFLIGLDHKKHQQINSCCVKTLKRKIIVLNKQHNFDLLAEEWSKEINKKTHLYSYGRKTNKNHIFVEMSQRKKRLRGILEENELEDKALERVLNKQLPVSNEYIKQEKTIIMKSYFNKRENYWLNKIIKKRFKVCLLLCGSSHLNTIKIKIKKKHIKLINYMELK